MGLKDKIGFGDAWKGILAVWKSEWNFRFHIFATLIVIGVGLIVSVSLLEWALLFIVIGMVLVSELINTAIEKTIDYIKPEIHPMARFIKDAAAGAVLVSSIVAVIVGILIFLPKLI